MADRKLVHVPIWLFQKRREPADGPYPSVWWAKQREKVGQLFDDETVRFNSAISGQVDRFVEKNFTSDTLGVQLRGSDKFDFGRSPNLGRKVLPDEYFPHIDRYLEEKPDDAKIFVATDQRQWLKSLEDAYPGRVLSFADASLSEDNKNQMHAADNKALCGVEVLVDALLLTHCDYLLKCNAAVGETALVVNRELPFLDLNYEHQPFAARNSLGHFALAPAIRLLCWTWNRLAERGMSLARVVSVEGDRVVVDPGRPRELNTKVEHDVKAPRSPLFSRRFISDGFEFLATQLTALSIVYKEK